MKASDPFSKRVRDIVRAPSPEQPLTRAQKAFRTLLTKVESLQEAIDVEEKELDAMLVFYAAEIVPRLSKQTERRKELVRSLAPHINKSFFPGKDERHELREFIRDLLDEISKTEKGLVDADLHDIYNVFHGVGYAKDERKTIAAAREALAKMLADEGIEADLSELESATTEAAFMQKAEELMARVRRMREEEAEAARCAEHGHHATDDAEVRAEEEFRKRSIANIYKQLARVLHPDFERDSVRQQEKVELMQELTEAYRQGDLHTLLRLEMQWIQNESGDIDRLTEEKLDVYNSVLAEQVKGLEIRARELIYHPRYRPVVAFSNGLTKMIDGPAMAREVDEQIAVMERCLSLVGTIASPDDVRTAIASLRPTVSDAGTAPASNR